MPFPKSFITSLAATRMTRLGCPRVSNVAGLKSFPYGGVQGANESFSGSGLTTIGPPRKVFVGLTAS